MPDHPTYRPSTHGFHFTNGWPTGTSDIVISTPIGTVPIGDASTGLCGGMCFASLDLLQAGRQPPPGTDPPPGGGPIVNYLTWRLLASWNIPSGALTYYYWANTPDHDTALGIRHGVARMTIEDQLPQITRSIDQGSPCTLGLVTVYSADPSQLSNCHEVVAYGYAWNGHYLTLKVYDPNSPGNDGVTIGLDTSNPAHTTKIDHNVNIALPIRGFFFTPYSFSDPAAIAGPPWKDKEKEKEKEKEKDGDKPSKEHKDGKDAFKDADKFAQLEKLRDISLTERETSAGGHPPGWPLAQDNS